MRMPYFALALALVIPPGVVHAQQPQMYRSGDCIYQGSPVASRPNTLLGCYQLAGGRTWYADLTRGTLRDERTGYWLTTDAQNNFYIWTQRGWLPMSSVPAGQQMLSEIAAANRAAQQPRGATVTVGPGGHTGSGQLIIQQSLTPAERAALLGHPNVANFFNGLKDPAVPWVQR